MVETPQSPDWLDSMAPTRRNSAGSQQFAKPTIRIDEGTALKLLANHGGNASCSAEDDFRGHGRSTSDATRTNSPDCSPISEKPRHRIGIEEPVMTPADNSVDIYDPNRPRLGLRRRLRHFTWAWYTLPMSTGGLSLLIRAQPYQFPGLNTIGMVVYILNIILFAIISMTMFTRFFLHSGSMAQSVTHPREGFFVPTFFLAIATLITGTEKYAIPRDDVPLKWAIQTVFWIYVAVTAILSVGQYSYVFAAHSFGLQTMMPTWILPIFPIMLSGTIASVIAETQPEIRALPIIVAGLTCQGLGLSVAVLMYAHMIGRLMQSGLPNREHRPGLFMCVGPPAFTALALIGMAKSLPASSLNADVNIIRIIALMCAIFLWALSLWWFGIALVAVILSPPRYFHLGWWAMVFPNVGFTLATISIGRELNNGSVLWVTTGMSIVMLVTYFFVLFNHVRAVLKQDIMYTGRDEDVEDH